MPKFDVFLSHNSQDEPSVEELARRLQDVGISPFLDQWHLVPGEPWQEALEAALEESSTVAIFVGPSGVSPWHNEELRAALNRAVRSRDEMRVIPVLLPGATQDAVSGFLARRTWVDFRAGLDDQDAFARLVAGIQGAAIVDDVYQLPDDPAPYRGLLPFEAKHARFFYGREDDCACLIAKLEQHPFVALVGASGSGKSSLLRAGLLPALDQDALPGSGNWRTLVLSPGSRPLRALAEQLAALVPPLDRLALVDTLASRLAARADGLHTAVTSLLTERPQPVLLMIDQFEELFTLGQDEPERPDAQAGQFIANLADAVRAGDGRIRVVIALRADYLDRCLAFPDLGALLQDRQVLLGALTESTLRDAVVRPAQEVGAFYEKGLVSAILRDVAAQPGALPLLQHALYELWRARRGPWLTLEAYEDSGGVRGALQRRAQATYEALTPEGQRIARALMLRLVAPGEGTSDARRRVPRPELYPVQADPGQVDAVLLKLSSPQARLIVVDRGSVEIAHETLIQAWPTLRAWIEQEREALRTHRRLAEAAAEWEGHDRNESYLHQGARLAQAREWAQSRIDRLNRLERAFLETSIAAAEARRRRERRRTRNALIASLTVAVVLAVLGLFAFRQRNDALRAASDLETAAVARQAEADLRATAVDIAETRGAEAVIAVATEAAAREAEATARVLVETRGAEAVIAVATEAAAREQEAIARAIAATKEAEAIEQARITRSRQLAAQALANLEASPPRGLLLSIEAITARHSVPAAEEALRQLLATAGGVPLGGRQGEVYAAAFSPDGQWLALAGWYSGGIQVWDLADRPSEPLVLTDFGGDVFDVAFSPNGRWLATGHGDWSARLWDLDEPTGGPVVLSGTGTSVTEVVYSPDGRWLATGGDEVVRLWDMQDPAAGPLELRGHTDGVVALAYSPDGHWLASGSRDQTVRLWAVSESPAEVAVYSGYSGPVWAVRFSPDGRWLATVGEEDQVLLSDLTRPAANPVPVRGHQARIRGVAFSPDGRWMATASEDQTARLWDLRDLAARPEVLPGHVGIVTGAAFGPDGRWLATSSFDATVRLWQMANLSAAPVVLRGHEDIVWRALYSPDGRWLVTVSEDGTTRLWDLHNPFPEPVVLPGHLNLLRNLCFSPDGRTLAASGEGNEIRLWDANDPSVEPVPMRGHEDQIYALACDPQGRWLASGGVDGIARLWDTAHPEAPPTLLPGHGDTINAVAFSPDGRWLATASEDTTVRVWSVGDSAVDPIVLDQPAHPVYSVLFSPNGRWLTTGGADSVGRLWQMQSLAGDPIVLRDPNTNVFGSVLGVAFSPEGRWLATSGAEATVRLWDLDAPTPQPTLLKEPELDPNAGMFAVAFSPDGHWLAAGGIHKTVWLWDTADLSAQPAVFRGKPGWAGTIALAFTPDGGRFATESGDHAVRLWDTSRLPSEPILLQGHTDRITALVSSPDGRWLASASTDGTVRLWRMDLEELVSLACRTAGRNLTADEWQQFFGDEPYRETCAEWPAAPVLSTP